MGQGHIGTGTAKTAEARKVKALHNNGTDETVKIQAAIKTSMTLHVGNSTLLLSPETTPRGFRAQHVYRKPRMKGTPAPTERYRFRIQLTNYPKKGTMGGKLTVIELKDGDGNRKATTLTLPEQLTTYPTPPFAHDWDNVLVDLGTSFEAGGTGPQVETCRIILSS